MAEAHTNHTAEPKAQPAVKIIHLLPGEKQIVLWLCANNSHKTHKSSYNTLKGNSRNPPVSPQINIFLQQGEDAKGKQVERYTSPCHTGKSLQSSFGSYCIMEFVIGKKSFHGHFLLWVFLNVNSSYAFPRNTAHAVCPSPATLTGPLWCLFSFRRTVR